MICLALRQREDESEGLSGLCTSAWFAASACCPAAAHLAATKSAARSSLPQLLLYIKSLAHASICWVGGQEGGLICGPITPMQAHRGGLCHLQRG